MMSDDMALVREYAQSNSEQAFSTFVSRHVNLVYSVALRQLRDHHLAEEVTQGVFIILAQKAKSLSPKTILSGWLCRTARHISADTLKTQRRRQIRERESLMQSILNEPESGVWNQIAPLLDEALGCLGEKEHDAVVLRFLDGKELKQVGAAMGTTEDAARMRVNRGLEKLRRFFTKKGVTLSTTAIAGAVAANSVQAAPVGLTATITAVALSGTAITTAAFAAATKSIATTTILKVSAAAVVVACLCVAIYETTRSPKRSPIFSVGDAQKLVVPYTVEFAVQSQWHVSNQVRDDQQVQVRVSVDLNQVLIQSRSPTNEMLGPMTWATSPFRTNEWISARPPLFGGTNRFGTNRFGSNRFDTVQIDKSPYTGMDEITRLALFLYVPTTHPTFRGLGQREIVANASAMFSYAPDELVFQLRQKVVDSLNLPVEITVRSPNYFYKFTPTALPLDRLPPWLSRHWPKGSSAQVAFKGPPFNRTLSVLSIQQYTNWNGLLLPMQFSYARYSDPGTRAKLETEEVIASFDGTLISITQGAAADLRTQLRSQVSVVDFRPFPKLLRAPAQYQAECGKWPVSGTPEYRNMVRTNAAAIAANE